MIASNEKPLSIPFGVYPIPVAAISSAPHSPQAVPSARSPSGVSTMSARRSPITPLDVLGFFSERVAGETALMKP